MAKTTTATKKNKRNGGENRNEIGATPLTISDLLGCSVSDFEAIDCILQSFEYREGMWQYGINRSEMWCLLALNGYLKIVKRNLCSHDKFIDYLSGNYKHRARFVGFIRGLMDLKCIGSFEYNRHPGSLSIGISDYGFTLIRKYYSSMYALLGRYVTDKNLENDNLRSISVAENIPVYYNSLQSA